MRRILACLSLLLTLIACGQKADATATLAKARPFQILVPTSTPTFLPGLTEIFPPTPTIFTYTVVQGDTLSGIARRLGVSLDALLAANPGVSPTVLAVGTKLVIPVGDLVPSEPAPTPATLPLRQARCWPESTGGVWCLALLQNDYAEPLENLSAQIALVDPNGQELAVQVVYGLLDILPPGSAMPLAAHFVPPVQDYSYVRVQVLTAIRLLPGDMRYLPVNLENTLVTMDASGRTAQASGRVVLNGTATANTLWVLASAYTSDGIMVGVRRWESATALTAEAPVSFDFQVSSVGPGIARVEFLAEARP
jgi:LysM repeat protein